MDDFIKLVEEMRKLQKQYFKTRDRDVLIRSKEAERKVDIFIKDLREPKLGF